MTALRRLLEVAGNAIATNATAITKAVTSHLSRNGSKYLMGGGAAAGGGLIFAAGKAVGHTQGKKEGTAEQAMRDKKKIEDMHKQHETDREKWNKQRKKYEDIIDELID